MSRSPFCVGASVILFLTSLAVVPVRLAAQAATATVLGTVTDQSGAAIPGVAVDVKNTATGVSQTAISDSRGRYRVPNLPIGPYEVKAELQGFQTAIHKGVELAVGSERVVDFVLSVGQVSETVTVSQQVPLVETTSSQLSNLVDLTQICELPLNADDITAIVAYVASKFPPDPEDIAAAEEFRADHAYNNANR